MSDLDAFQWTNLTAEQREILEANWAGAQDMLAHLMALHDMTPTPHPAVLSGQEFEQYQQMDVPQLTMVLRAAVVALCGASSFIADTIGQDAMDAITATVEKLKTDG